MCDPVTGVVTLASVLACAPAATAVVGVVTAKQAADAQAESNAAQAKNALQVRSNNMTQIGLEQQQQHDAAGQKINANNTALREAQATAIAGSNGVSGLSVDALIGDMGRKGATYNSSVEQNLARQSAALDNQAANVNTATSNVFNQLKTPESPDYLGAALKIGGAYNTYQAGKGG